MDKAQEASALMTLETVGALKKGHFVLKSGLHAEEYVDVRELFAYSEEMWGICKLLAELFLPDDVDTVAGVARGGNYLAHGVAYWIRQIKFPRAKKDPEDSPIRTAFTEKTESGFGFAFYPQHQKHIPGKKILVIEDTTTTGNSPLSVVKEAQRLGGNVVGLGIVWNRGTIINFSSIKIFSLIDQHIPAWPENECPLCKDHIEINTEVGHGKEFLDRKIGLI